MGKQFVEENVRSMAYTAYLVMLAMHLAMAGYNMRK